MPPYLARDTRSSRVNSFGLLCIASYPQPSFPWPSHHRFSLRRLLSITSSPSPHLFHDVLTSLPHPLLTSPSHTPGRDDAQLVLFVDNCYGEFVEPIEPCDVGAHLVAGSLIKNPGGTLAPSGGYVAGRYDASPLLIASIM